MDLHDIGTRVQFLRLNKANMCQKDFAELIGIDRTYLSKIEAGKQNFTLDTFLKICKGLNVSPCFFFNFEIIAANNEGE